jgi:uncharacterized BrkB/YihY/UPF0761 family membrane protein
MRIFKIWGRLFIDKFLTLTLLLAVSFAWLVLIFIPLLLAQQHAYGAWYDYNVPVLIVEAIACIFAIVWAIIKIVATIKKEQWACGKT